MKILLWFRRVFLVLGAWALAGMVTRLTRHHFLKGGIVYSSGGPILEHVVSTYYQSLWALIAGATCGFGLETRRPVLTGAVLAGVALLSIAATLVLNPSYLDAMPHPRALVVLAVLVFMGAYACGAALQGRVMKHGGGDAP